MKKLRQSWCTWLLTVSWPARGIQVWNCVGLQLMCMMPSVSEPGVIGVKWQASLTDSDLQLVEYSKNEITVKFIDFIYPEKILLRLKKEKSDGTIEEKIAGHCWNQRWKYHRRYKSAKQGGSTTLNDAAGAASLQQDYAKFIKEQGTLKYSGRNWTAF